VRLTGPSGRSPRGKPGRDGGPVIVQPAPEAPAAAPGQAQEPEAGPAPAPAAEEGQRAPSHGGMARPEPRRFVLQLVGGWVVLGLAAAGVGAAAVLGWGPFNRQGSETERHRQELAQALQQQAMELCRMHDPSTDPAEPAAAPEGGRPGTPTPPPVAAAQGNPSGPQLDPARLRRITTALTMRRSIVLGLRNGTKAPSPFLVEPARDPLSALIAWSFLQADLNPSAPQPDLAAGTPGPLAWLPGWLKPSRQDPAPLAPPLCPELRVALQKQWTPQRGPIPFPSSLPLSQGGSPAKEPLAAPLSGGSAEPPSQR
jgi:hypothetical protein